MQFVLTKYFLSFFAAFPNLLKSNSFGLLTMEDPIKILEQNFQAILNKLTPQNFDKLVAEFKMLKIDTVPKLEACVELIFEKAVDEHEFSQSYARMCEVLSGKKVTNDGQKPMNFQRMMITRCQKEFEKDYMAGKRNI